MADTDDPFSLTPSSPLVTVADPRPAPTDDKAQARIDKLHSLSEESVTRAERSMAHEDEIREDRMRALAPVRQRMSDLAAQPLPQIPETKAPPAVPERPNQQDQETWLMASGLLGALAGAFTRRHQTNALAAFTGAMDGYNEGSRQKYDQNMKIWEAENKKALEENSRAMDHYRSILENRKLSMDQMSIQLQMAAQQYDDAGMAAAAQTKNALVIAQHYDKEAEAAGRARTSAESLSLGYARLKQKEQSELLKQQVRAAGVDPGKTQDFIDAIGQYRAPPIRGRAGTAIMEEVYRQYGGQDDAHPKYEEGKWIAARIAAQTDAKTAQRSEGAFAVGPEGRQVRSLNVAIAHLGTLEELGKAIGNSDFPLVNELANKVSYELGYPMPTTFEAAKQIVSAEVVKAVVANGGGVTERQEAARMMSNANSWAQMNDVIRAYKSLLAGQMKGLKKQYESSTHRDDFDSKLEPETIEALKGAGVAPMPSATPPGYRAIGDNRNVLEQLGVVFPNYKSGDPYVSPEESVKQGRQGVGTKWNPFGGSGPLRPMVELPGWKVEEIGEVPETGSTGHMPFMPLQGWKVEQVQ